MNTRKNIFLVVFPLLLGFVSFLWADHLYGQHVESLARSGQWIETKTAKTAYMNEVKDSFDVVFVGSSRTQNHINTHWLNEKGVDCFNLGLSAQQLFNTVYLVEQAAKAAKKYVVLSVTIRELFRKNVEPAQHPTWSDLRVFFEFPSTILEIKVKEILHLFHLHRNQSRMAAYRRGRVEVEKLHEELNTFYGYDDLNDPRAIHYIRKGQSPSAMLPGYVVTYVNGDGQIFGSTVSPNMPIETIDHTGELPKQSTIDYVNMLSDIVKTESPETTLVLNLILVKAARQHIIDIEKVRGLFPDVVVVESQCAIESQYWADHAHYNGDGSRIYTEVLLSHLEELLAQNP